MRLHHLRLRAVGPFADEQDIDFDRLSAGGLFLFEGPTGVGKSTILDALTFALYGGLASDSGDPARLRSHHAAPEERPEVRLEFSVRGQRHRITRSPEYTRPKRRGSGETTEKSSVHLERLLPDGGWESRSHAKDEVGAVIGDLLGLTRQQFRQVVLLPQGEFATFLRAGDDQRREVLGRLFGTEFFSSITAGLKQRAAQLGRARQEGESRLQQRVAAAGEAAGIGAGEQAESEGLTHPERIHWLTMLDARLQRRQRAAALVAAAAEADHGAAQSAVSRAESLVARVGERDAALAALADAQAQRPHHAARCAELSRARRAAPVRGLLDHADSAEHRVATQRQAVGAASPDQAPDPQHLEGRGAHELAGAASVARTTVGELEHLVAVEDGLPELRERIASRHADVAQLHGELAQLRSRAEAVPAELAVVSGERETAQMLVAQLEPTRGLLVSEQDRAEVASRIGALEDRVQQARLARRDARRALDGAEDHHALLSDRRLSDLRGELAETLVSGDPCLVCGSPEHPAPALRTRAGVSSEQLDEAAAARDHARLALDAAELALHSAQADLRHARTTAGDRSPAEWIRRVDELRSQVVAGEAARSRLDELQERVLGLQAEQQDVGSRVLTLGAEAARVEQQLTHDQADLTTREGEVERARAGHPSVRSRIEDLVAHAESLDQRSAAVRDLHDGLVELDRARTRAAAEATAAGFPDLADARSALLTPAETEQLERDIDRWEATVADATTRLASPELAAVADIDSEPASEALARALTQLEHHDTRWRVAHEELTVAKRQQERFRERLTEVRACFEEFERLAAVHEQVAQLDLYARGMAGTPRMTLVTYVLRFWFEEVVRAANARLDAMSAGKYELLRIDDAARRDARVGLGLAVLDRHTGRSRSPATLSGGETFYTSLSLALGLADVVVAQAGGAQLDTLFIDEGFGSLDPDTLDDVMGVIDDLRGGGRVVGIVSHVPELKERIAERLTIRRERPDGPSRIAVVA